VHLEILVEGPSDEKALLCLVPRIIGEQHTIKIHPFGNKKKLLDNLPNRLRAYSRWIPDDYRIVVLVDEDRQDCHKLKNRLIEVARKAHIEDKVLNRIAVEELEAWFFGDPDALKAAYPKLPNNFRRRNRYRNPDLIGGGTWEALHHLIKSAHYPGYPKIEGAGLIASYMEPSRNYSRSFQVFRDGLVSLVTG